MLTEILYQFARRISKETKQTVIYEECGKEALVFRKLIRNFSTQLVNAVFDANMDALKDLHAKLLEDLKRDN